MATCSPGAIARLRSRSCGVRAGPPKGSRRSAAKSLPASQHRRRVDHKCSTRERRSPRRIAGFRSWQNDSAAETPDSNGAAVDEAGAAVGSLVPARARSLRCSRWGARCRSERRRGRRVTGRWQARWERRGGTGWGCASGEEGRLSRSWLSRSLQMVAALRPRRAAFGRSRGAEERGVGPLAAGARVWVCGRGVGGG